ncbi:hypothetical protein BX070DRAFT_228045 [Coemansia spiralis]|nr:hypothetical protein BX070DRAFT_228045 [Coemansia spiralis]
MDSLLEQQRQAYEDIERLEQAIVDLMLQDLTKHRYKLIREQKISELLNQVQSRSRLVADIENDASGLRKKDVDEVTKDRFDDFYKKLRLIRSYYRLHPEAIVIPPELEYIKYKNNPEELEDKRKEIEAKVASSAKDGDEDAEILAETEHSSLETFVTAESEEKLETIFSGEERLGRYVDLNEQYELYLNIKDAKHLTYLEYLAVFTKLEDYPRKNKSNRQYTDYLLSLRKYFEGFFARAMPLFNVRKTNMEAEENFALQWQNNEASGWETDTANGSLEQELFCAACKKNFEKETTYSAHMNSRKHMKTVARLQNEEKNSGGADAAMKRAYDEKAARDKEVAWMEHLIRTYAQVLADRISDTRSNVERRQALTEEERKDDKDDQIYNPLNLPLGWDGKPIPYWLYKLHGLGVKFSCEICGNAVYRGRKAYEKHFQESRHATNMRRLGIPNTRQFHGVSSIEEALALWERIQKEKKQEVSNSDTFEEFEDSEGNVFNKKTYLDLKRQGLI